MHITHITDNNFIIIGFHEFIVVANWMINKSFENDYNKNVALCNALVKEMHDLRIRTWLKRISILLYSTVL